MFESQNFHDQNLPMQRLAGLIVDWLDAKEKSLNETGQTVLTFIVHLEFLGEKYANTGVGSVAIKTGEKTEEKQAEYYFTNFLNERQIQTGVNAIYMTALKNLSREEIRLKEEGKTMLGYSVAAYGNPNAGVAKGGAFIKTC